jgi:hypothetical protein
MMQFIIAVLLLERVINILAAPCLVRYPDWDLGMGNGC